MATELKNANKINWGERGVCILRAGPNQSSHSFYFDSFVNSSSLYPWSIWPHPNAIRQVMHIITEIISYVTLPAAEVCYCSSHHEIWLQFTPKDLLHGYLDCSLSLFYSVVSAVGSNITPKCHNHCTFVTNSMLLLNTVRAQC